MMFAVVHRYWSHSLSMFWYLASGQVAYFPILLSFENLSHFQTNVFYRQQGVGTADSIVNCNFFSPSESAYGDNRYLPSTYTSLKPNIFSQRFRLSVLPYISIPKWYRKKTPSSIIFTFITAKWAGMGI